MCARAEVPRLVDFHGEISIDGVPYEGTGLFKFALMDELNGHLLWSSDAPPAGDIEPVQAISVAVHAGHYTVRLGDTSLPNMAALPLDAFDGNQVAVRVWFGTATLPSQLLEPDQRVAAVAYALMAATVANGAITTEKLADGAVRGSKLGPIDAGLITSGTLSTARLSGVPLLQNNLSDLTNLSAARDNLQIAEPRLGLSRTTTQISTGHWPLVVSVTGDSVIGNKFFAISRALRSSFGEAGYTLGGLAFRTSGAATLISNGFDVWPNGLYVRVEEDGIAELAVNAQSPAMGETLKVYYVREENAGRFKVQVSTDDGPFLDEPGFTNVSAAGELTGRVLTIIKPRPALRKIRVVGLEGAVKVIGAAIYRAGYEGVVIGYIAQGGIDLNSMVLAPPAIVAPIMADVSPDLFFFEMKDDDTLMKAYLERLRALIGGAADWVMIGSSPSAFPDVDVVQRRTNQWLRGYAAAKGLTYFDGYSLFQDGPTAQAKGLLSEDGVHLTNAGMELAVAAMFNQLGLDHLATGTSRDGNRLGPTIIRGLGDTSLTISSPTNHFRALFFQNEDGTPAGGLISNREDDPSLPGGLSLTASFLPIMKASQEGRFSFGLNPLPPQTGSYEFNLTNPSLVGLSLISPVASQPADFFQCRLSDSSTPFRIDGQGAVWAAGLNISGGGLVFRDSTGNTMYGLRLNNGTLEYQDAATGWNPLSKQTSLQGNPVSNSQPTDGDSLRWNAALNQWQPATATGSVSEIGKTLWADATNGSDSTGRRGRMDRPFKTLGAAKDAAAAGDTVIVYPGRYAERNLLRDGVNWLFLPGAEIVYAGLGAVWDDAATGAARAVVCRIDGAANMTHLAGGPEANVFKLTNPGSKVTVHAAQLTAAGTVIDSTAGRAQFQIENISTTGSNLPAILSDGGNVEIRGARIVGKTNLPLVYQRGARGGLRLRDCTVINLGTRVEATCLLVGGTFPTVLDRCTLVAGPGSRTSVTAAVTPGKIKSYFTMANRAVQRGVVDQAGPLRIDPEVSE